jgi:cytidylate kinase
VSDHSVIPVVTVDGPAASGKGTLAAGLARALSFHLLDSGALYRMVALKAINAKTSPDDISTLAAIAASIRPAHENAGVFLDGEEVSNLIRRQDVGEMASKVAKIAEVRANLLEAQRMTRRMPGLVADGRDMGTVVFPDATVKFFITATIEARAKRRFEQLLEKHLPSKMADLVQEIRERDERDTQRLSAPLKPADDAIFIDTTSLSVSEVLDHALRHCRRLLK